MTPPTVINPADGAVMAWIAAGEFHMGSIHEGPVHTVFLDGFWIYTRQVTNRQYLLFCQHSGTSLPEDPIPGYLACYPDHPVINVSWDEARVYANRVNGRLPTEAEWEKAALGGLERLLYPWGDAEPLDGEWANFKYYTGKLASQRLPFDKRGRGPLPVGSFAPNGYGLYDMGGNAWDWVFDYYDPDYYYDSPPSNPTGPTSGNTRVRRGGDWARSALSMRCACRSSMPPESRDFRMGFRVVLDANPYDSQKQTHEG